MSIILTDITGKIITYDDQPWRTPGEYVNPLFHVVLCEWPSTEKPVAVTSLGPAVSCAFETHEGPIICPRVHENATVETEPMESEVV